MDMKARLEANTEDEIDGPSFSYEDLKRASSVFWNLSTELRTKGTESALFGYMVFLFF
jgi:hypothetical protein